MSEENVDSSSLIGFDDFDEDGDGSDGEKKRGKNWNQRTRE